MIQFSIPSLYDDNQFRISDQSDCHHIKVLRLKTGDTISLLVGNQRYLGMIDVINYDSNKVICSVSGHVIEQLPNRSNPYRVELYFPVYEKKYWDSLVDHLTQLGVDKLIPVTFHYDQKQSFFSENFVLRLNKIVKSSVNQSNGSNMLVIESSPITFNDMTQRLSRYDHVLFGSEYLIDKNDKHIPVKIKDNDTIGLIVGPAGGFSEYEHQTLLTVGKPVKVSQTILRSPLAALSLVNLVYFYYNYGK